MLMLRILLCVALIAVLAPGETEAWGRFRLRWRFRRPSIIRAGWRIIKIIHRCKEDGKCFSSPESTQLCRNVEKAVVPREEWKAIQPRQQEEIEGIADKVVVYHTGANTCRVMGLSEKNCQSCLQDESCVKQLILAMQNDDLKNGKTDIRYNFIIGQDGVIYEGRGWDVVGGHTDGDFSTSIGVAILGDFSKSEPSEALQNALNNLMLCGEAAGVLSRGSSLVTEPKLSGEALDQMIRRCKGMCIE